MILLRSFPLSLSIFTQLLVRLPLWFSYYLVLILLTVFGSLFALSLPLLGVIVWLLLAIGWLVISAILTMHPWLVGIRCGLNILGHKTEQDEGRLMLRAAFYGFAEAICGFMISAVTICLALMIVTGTMDLSAFQQAEHLKDPTAEIAQALAAGQLTLLSILTALAVLALRAAFLPALASAAAGRDPGGRVLSPLNGFGSGLIGMIVVLCIAAGISAFAIPALGAGAAYIGLIDVLTRQLGEVVLFAANDGKLNFTLKHVVLIASAVLFAIWVFSYKCAAVALNYDQRVRQVVARRQMHLEDRKGQAGDIRALRQSRMKRF